MARSSCLPALSPKLRLDIILACHLPGLLAAALTELPEKQNSLQNFRLSLCTTVPQIPPPCIRGRLGVYICIRFRRLTPWKMLFWCRSNLILLTHFLTWKRTLQIGHQKRKTRKHWAKSIICCWQACAILPLSSKNPRTFQPGKIIRAIRQRLFFVFNILPHDKSQSEK